MPQGPAPDKYNDLLIGTALGHLATVNQHGHPQVNPVWFLREAGQVLLSIQPVTQKYRNLQREPHLALSILDTANPGRYVELRGEVVEWELYRDLTFVNSLAQKYTGADYTHGFVGQERYKVTIRIDSWTGQ